MTIFVSACPSSSNGWTCPSPTIMYSVMERAYRGRSSSKRVKVGMMDPEFPKVIL